MDLSRDNLRLGWLGIGVPLAVNGMGHFVLIAASFEEMVEALAGQGSTQSVSWCVSWSTFPQWRFTLSLYGGWSFSLWPSIDILGAQNSCVGRRPGSEFGGPKEDCGETPRKCGPRVGASLESLFGGYEVVCSVDEVVWIGRHGITD